MRHPKRGGIPEPSEYIFRTLGLGLGFINQVVRLCFMALSHSQYTANSHLEMTPLRMVAVIVSITQI